MKWVYIAGITLVVVAAFYFLSASSAEAETYVDDSTPDEEIAGPQEGTVSDAFASYTNRYGRKLVMISTLLEQFYVMQNALALQGVDVEMTNAWRGEAEQNADKAKGVSRAAWGQSAHNYGAAFDLAPVIDGTLTWPPASDHIWQTIGQAGKDAGLEWGGEFTTIVDMPHFDIPGWKSAGLTLYPESPIVV